MPDVSPAPRDNPEWMAGYAAGTSDAHAGETAQMLRLDEDHGLTWHRGYMVGRQAHRDVVAPAGWPTIIAIAASETFVTTSTARWPRPARLAGALAVGAATQRLGVRSGRRRANRLGYMRMGDLPPTDPMVSMIAPAVAVSVARQAWWRLRHGRAEMPRGQRTAPRELARGVIVAGVLRLEWDRRNR